MPAEAHPDLWTWCFQTKKQGIAGSEAPRPCRHRPIRTWGRGASRRRNKGLRGVKHHVHAGIGPSGHGDVVPPDEGIRDCGERSTTSHRRRRIGLQRLGAKETKEQGFAGVFAPSPKGWSSEKGQRLGAKKTEKQGFAGIRAPSPKPRSGAPPKPDAGNPPLGAYSGPEP